MVFNEDLERVMEYFKSSGAFLTSSAEGKTNTMTISWGGIGFLWNKPCFTVYVRPQRYTRGFIDKSKSFTVSVPFGGLKEELSICGTKSGKDIDKSEIVNFIPAKQVSPPIVEGCGAYYECVVRYVQRFGPDLLPEDIKNNIYPDADFHYVYFGEIVKRY
ncbi:MAG: flavin reductase family protein [Clostridiales bacterium]|jgi:flavin reductase (DIM6/NTAB) family NADH-FMN oxidoreductase RutF|nr:flavin reductase family protein [Clostridiales bacterium]